MRAGPSLGLDRGATMRPQAPALGPLQRARSLPTRTFVVVALACAMMVGLQAWREWVAWAEQVRETEASLANLARSLVQQAEGTFGMADVALASFVERVETDGTSPAALARLDRVLAAGLAVAPGVHAFIVFDENGDWLATSMPAKGGNNADRDYFRRHRSDPGRGPQVGPPIRSRSTGRWNVTLTRRLQHEDGRFAGIVLAMIDLSHFVDHYATFDLGPRSAITLDSIAGVLLARFPFNEADVGRDMSDAKVFDALRTQPSGSYETVAVIDGVRRFSGYSRGVRFPLVAVASMSDEHAMGAWRAGARLHLASAAVLAGVVGLLGLHLARQMWRRQAAEDRVRESEGRYRLVAENSSDLITLNLAFDGPRAYVSPASRAVVGYEPAELATLPMGRYVHPDDLERVAAEYATLSPDAPTTRSVHRVRHKAGHWVWVEALFQLAGGGGGQGVVAAARDITERHRLEAERDARERDLAHSNAELDASNAELKRLAGDLARARDRAERANRAKSRFLAGMTHELRTPLNGVLGYAQLLRLEGGLSERQVARVNAMLGAGSHLLDMINCVLDLSEIEAEHVTLRMAEVDLRAAAKVCLDLVRSAAEAKGLSLRLAVAPDVPGCVTTDATRLRQVLLNLLGNAVKFTPEGAVELRICLADGALRLEVADTGPGISAGQRHRLFQDFDRLDVEETSTIEGTGLGLAISARLAVLLGGRLGHEDNPGGGSLFWMALPAVAAAPAAVAAAPVAAGTPAAPAPPVQRPSEQVRALHVLVADDVAMNRDVAAAFLRRAGHAVSMAADGAEAVAMAAATAFDVVLMDVRMPVMDGLEAASRIRALPGAHGQTPIVAMTAQTTPEQVAACRASGMDAYLCKPFAPEALLDMVAEWAAAGRQRDPCVAPPAPAEDAAPPPAPLAGLDLPVLDPATFEQTTALLPPELVLSSLRALAEQASALLRGLHAPHALAGRGNQLAEAAHALAGSAGLFGFDRLATLGRRFEHAVEADAPDAPAMAESLAAAVQAALLEIERRVPALLDALELRARSVLVGARNAF